MKGGIVRFLAFAGIVLLNSVLFAQEEHIPKYALVIGNGAYTNLSPLVNPVNDANDIGAALESLGFVVDKVLDGNLFRMEEALTRLKDRLKGSVNSYGFLYYAGHGVQPNGENFLIPLDANIPSENYLRDRSLSVQAMLNELNDARNCLNVVVLDACRDNPFSWSRSSTRGLAVVTGQPADSIIVYATSAGQRASDGIGKNGLFTSQLLPNLLTPGIDVNEVFRRTGADVSEISNREQIPAIYNQFFGIAYLGKPGEPEIPVRPRPLPSPGSNDRGTGREAKLWTIGVSVGTSFSHPWLIGTAYGTIAPFRYSFLKIGLDAGFISGVQGVGYYSVFPYAHYAAFVPFTLGQSLNAGWYAGAGAGYLISELDYPTGKVPVNSFALELTTGFNIINMIDICYTFRTDFKTAGSKLSLGYFYRFK